MIVYKVTSKYFNSSSVSSCPYSVRYNQEVVYPVIKDTPLFVFKTEGYARDFYTATTELYGILVCEIEDDDMFECQHFMLSYPEFTYTSYLQDAYMDEFESAGFDKKDEVINNILSRLWQKIRVAEKEWLLSGPGTSERLRIYRDFEKENGFPLEKVPNGTILVKRLKVISHIKGECNEHLWV